MDEKQHYGMETRQRLLDVACELFAEVGFEQASLAQIAERAKANKASINYHFRSKEALYQECWRLVLRRSHEVYPYEGDIPADAGPEARLRGRIHAILARMADPCLREFQLVFQEMVNPTGLLAEVIRETVAPMYAGFAAVVDELLGPKATELHRELCLRSMMGQCLDLMAMERRRATSATMADALVPPKLNVDLDTLTDHITRFSLAGIRETRRYLETAGREAVQRKIGLNASGRK